MATSHRHGLLSTRICDLALEIDGTFVERLVSRLYYELDKAGLAFKPRPYLSDGWGCPDRVPAIGIPFYLADPELGSLRTAITGVAPETDTEAMMVLRHEAGHAFNYAYRLYDSPQWRRTFGDFSLPYEDKYTVTPFSPRFVRHVPGWYVQRHPDDDFAETFAVWLTPGSNWRQAYRDTPALVKLSYVDEVARRFGKEPPIVATGELDMPVEQMTMTLGSWFKKQKKRRTVRLHRIIDLDLRRLFPDEHGPLAVEVLGGSRHQLIRDVHLWTGIDRRLLAALLDALLSRIGLLGLKVDTVRASERIAGFFAFATTLAMNYVGRGRFVPR